MVTSRKKSIGERRLVYGIISILLWHVSSCSSTPSCSERQEKANPVHLKGQLKIGSAYTSVNPDSMAGSPEWSLATQLADPLLIWGKLFEADRAFDNHGLAKDKLSRDRYDAYLRKYYPTWKEPEFDIIEIQPGILYGSPKN